MAESNKQNWEILYGGADLEVNRVVTVPNAVPPEKLETETVKVRKVPLRKMQDLAKAWGSIEKEMPIYVDRPADWFDSLTDESALAIIQEGRRLNEKTFAAWLRLQTQAAETITGEKIDVAAKVNQAMAQASA
jgi:hypothetical protein